MAEKKKETTTSRGYGWAHQQLRRRMMKKYPLCQRCGEHWSYHLHHKNRNPHDREPGNVEIICPGCHAMEHSQ